MVSEVSLHFPVIPFLLSPENLASSHFQPFPESQALVGASWTPPAFTRCTSNKTPRRSPGLRRPLSLALTFLVNVIIHLLSLELSLLFTYLFERERQRQRAGKRVEGEGQADPLLRTEPDQGLDPTTLGL